MIRWWLTAFLCLCPSWVAAQVVYDATSESHGATTGSASEASFGWTHTPVGTPRGALVFVIGQGSASGQTTSVTYGGTAMSAVSGGAAADTAGELAHVAAYYLGASVPTGAQTVTVNRNNNATVLYAVAFTVTAGGDTEVHTGGIVLLQEDQTVAEQSVTDGSPGNNSVRFAGMASGGAGVPSAGASSTLAHDIDLGAFVNSAVRETTAGQGARSIGWSIGAPDDVAAVHLAVKQSGGAGATCGARTLLGVGCD